jgi:DNA-binding NtrC family response regulator
MSSPSNIFSSTPSAIISRLPRPELPDSLIHVPIQRPQETSARLSQFGDLYGSSQPMHRLFQLIKKVAPTRANVLIVGESGTGKELVASTIHHMREKEQQPFIALNCGAISPQLIEAELFGHEKGSFTGAIRTHKGCFERADGGTIFLDEVTEMPMEMQVKLLRVLETGRFHRVGADTETHVRVRVIAATNRDPMQAIEAGLLRSDLFYRLAVFPIEVPTLRERGEDVELLAALFLTQMNEEEQTDKRFSRMSVQLMREYAWPGNVRELKNVVYRAFIMADRELDIRSALEPLKSSVASNPIIVGDCVTLPLGSRLADAEKKLICATLGHCGGNKTRTAEILGVSLKTLYNRLNEYETKIFPGPAAQSQPYAANG